MNGLEKEKIPQHRSEFAMSADLAEHSTAKCWLGHIGSNEVHISTNCREY